MKIAEGLVDACRDPFTLWVLCGLRRDDRFGEFVRNPDALLSFVVSEEKRLEEIKEESSTLTPDMVVYSRMTSHRWRTTHRLKGTSMKELIEGLSKALSSDNIIWPVLYTNEDHSDNVKVTLTRCYHTFS
ncbi:hypothetical protein ABGO80_000592 [Salmonella enterica subsp. enterica serovar Braenderup]|nr:hypothetical protein [Salmonella enterica subsp. enterica serovar Heidelberg]ECO0419372.1 hypothetical protein [Salmonella enterica subsp. enterica serovar Typhimurium]